MVWLLFMLGCGSTPTSDAIPAVSPGDASAALVHAKSADTDGNRMELKHIVMPQAASEWKEVSFRVAGAPQWKGDDLLLAVETGAGCGEDRFSLTRRSRSTLKGLVELNVVREHRGAECKAVSIEEVTLGLDEHLDAEQCSEGLLLHLPAKDPVELRFDKPRGACTKRAASAPVPVATEPEPVAPESQSGKVEKRAVGP